MRGIFTNICQEMRSLAARATVPTLAAVSLSFFASGAGADTLYTYTFTDSPSSITGAATVEYESFLYPGYPSGQLYATAEISGTFVFDESSNTITSADITLSTSNPNVLFPGTSETFTLVPGQNSQVGNDYYIQVEDQYGDLDQFLFDTDADLNADLAVALDPGGYYTNYGGDTEGSGVFGSGNGSGYMVPISTLGYADPSPVPEPASLTLLGAGLLGLGWMRRRRSTSAR